MSAGTGITRCGDPGRGPHVPTDTAEAVSNLHIAQWAPTE